AHYAARCLRAGARGYLQKDSEPEEIVAAIERVAAGRRYISPQLSGAVAGDITRAAEPPQDLLSDREFEVFRLIAAGKSATEIADALHVSVKTVSTYRGRILEKTGLQSNAEIVAYAIRSGLL